MGTFTVTQKIGLAVMIVSLSGGFAGTVWSISSSFGALENAESAGIGPVGDEIWNAMLFTLGGLTGCVTGMLMVFFGRSRR
jgi:biopolymer transport protein ExbB/TolQ